MGSRLWATSKRDRYGAGGSWGVLAHRLLASVAAPCVTECFCTGGIFATMKKLTNISFEVSNAFVDAQQLNLDLTLRQPRQSHEVQGASVPPNVREVLRLRRRLAWAVRSYLFLCRCGWAGLPWFGIDLWEFDGSGVKQNVKMSSARDIPAARYI